MKIIHVLNHFLPSHIAGTEVYAYNLGKELHHLGHEAIFIMPNYGTPAENEYIHKGFRVICYGEPSVVDRTLQMGKP